MAWYRDNFDFTVTSIDFGNISIASTMAVGELVVREGS
jgi:hypothetical protein